MSRLRGGHVQLGQGVRFHHTVIFQGRGRLVVEGRVVFGFGMAGAMNAPILLQPREPSAEIFLGKGCAVMNGTEIIARSSIQIGSNTLVGPSCWIVDSDFHDINPSLRSSPGRTEPVVIEENVWIGARVIILKGVHIGRNAVVAAGCVVSKDVPANAVVAGNPMRIIRQVN